MCLKLFVAAYASGLIPSSELISESSALDNGSCLLQLKGHVERVAEVQTANNFHSTFHAEVKRKTRHYKSRKREHRKNMARMDKTRMRKTRLRKTRVRKTRFRKLRREETSNRITSDRLAGAGRGAGNRLNQRTENEDTRNAKNDPSGIVRRADLAPSVRVSTDEDIVTHGWTHYDGFVILTAANYAYRGVLVNWMASLQKLRIDNYIVLCLDDQMVLFMARIGRPCIYRPARGLGHKWYAFESDIWLRRFQTVQVLLNSGMNVLMSDADAIWLKDPTDLLRGDIAASRGMMPSDVASRFGVSVCMGFVYFRSVAPVRMLVEEILDKGVQIPGEKFDDQTEFNNKLVEHDLKFSKKLGYIESEEIDYGNVSIGEDMTIDIAMLDSRRFQRGMQKNDDAYIAHYLYDPAHAAETKQAQLKASGLWYIRENWENPTHGDTSSFASSRYFDAWITNVQILSQ